MIKAAAVIVAALGLVALAPSGLSAAPTQAQDTTVRRAIDEGNRRYLKALEDADATAFAALHAPDALEMPSSGPPIVRGRAAIKAQAADDFKTTKYLGGSIVTTNVATFPGGAYETGRYTFTYQTKGKQPAIAAGRYFVVWERQSDGSFLIKVDSSYPQACPKAAH